MVLLQERLLGFDLCTVGLNLTHEEGGGGAQVVLRRTKAIAEHYCLRLFQVVTRLKIFELASRTDYIS